MKPKYILSKKAEEDLSGIWKYTLYMWSREQADKYIAALMSACDDVADNPMTLGISYEHVRAGYRKYLVGKHIVFYKVQSDGSVFISRILHVRMDFDRHL